MGYAVVGGISFNKSADRANSWEITMLVSVNGVCALIEMWTLNHIHASSLEASSVYHAGLACLLSQFY